MLASTASTTAAASTSPGLGVLSEHNKLAISGSCIVTTNAAGQPVIGIPVALATMNAEGSFTSVTGPLLIENKPGKVVQYSGRLGSNPAVDVASFIVAADATNTLFVVIACTKQLRLVDSRAVIQSVWIGLLESPVWSGEASTEA